ncbi:methyltransferase domain-containing protein [Tabrizicola aquatica]|uniref:methyltransferase domain-containing protein n=1 Tax=Tabrizicola aquatica TaxID=909926 RepID=UPI000CD31808|nr:methyltransferase domain-containing protein [Tabrizicola aquatica]
MVADRIARAVAALPLWPGMRVLEIGCGPGVAAREVVQIVGPAGFVLGIYRSATAIAQAMRGSAAQIAAGTLAFRAVAAEEFVLLPGEAPFDLAFALRVGALDGRHPAAGALALPRIAAALVPGGRLYVDTGDPLTVLPLPQA